MKKIRNFLLAVVLAGLFLSLSGVRNGGAEPLPLPLHVPDGQWQPLCERADSGLQAALEESLKQEALWRSLIRDQKMAVGLVDLSEPVAPRFAQVNGPTMMCAASLPKIGILLAAYRSFEEGTLEETPRMHDDLVAMIRRSSNEAASRMVARIGLSRIEEILQDPRCRFYDPQEGGGIWVGGGYTKGGEWIPDPVKGLFHAATVTQVCRFYYLAANGRIVGPQHSREILEVLSKPELHDKFVKVLEKEVPLERLYRKSGTWKAWYSDSVLVWGENWRRYILAALVEDQQGERILRNLVPVVEQILKP